jgi:hypothetical protein
MSQNTDHVPDMQWDAGKKATTSIIVSYHRILQSEF